MKLSMFTLVVCIVLLLAACNGNGSIGTGTPTPCRVVATGFECNFPVDHPLTDVRVSEPPLPAPVQLPAPAPTLPPQPPCAAPAVNVINQRVTGSAAAQITLRDLPDLDLANVNFSQGQYRASAVPLTADCTLGPVTILLNATFGLNYQSEYQRGHGIAYVICILRSDYQFTAFKVFGMGHLDAAIQHVVEQDIRDDILLTIDFAVADQLNQTFMGTGMPLPVDADPRCNGWKRGF